MFEIINRQKWHVIDIPDVRCTWACTNWDNTSGEISCWSPAKLWSDVQVQLPLDSGAGKPLHTSTTNVEFQHSICICANRYLAHGPVVSTNTSTACVSVCIDMYTACGRSVCVVWDGCVTKRIHTLNNPAQERCLQTLHNSWSLCVLRESETLITQLFVGDKTHIPQPQWSEHYFYKGMWLAVRRWWTKHWFIVVLCLKQRISISPRKGPR